MPAFRSNPGSRAASGFWSGWDRLPNYTARYKNPTRRYNTCDLGESPGPQTPRRTPIALTRPHRRHRREARAHPARARAADPRDDHALPVGLLRLPRAAGLPARDTWPSRSAWPTTSTTSFARCWSRTAPRASSTSTRPSSPRKDRKFLSLANTGSIGILRRSRPGKQARRSLGRPYEQAQP